MEDPGNSKKNLLVKINMDGVPIGRKVDLYVYDSYEKLSLAVEELFAGLLAGKIMQRDSIVLDNFHCHSAVHKFVHYR